MELFFFPQLLGAFFALLGRAPDPPVSFFFLLVLPAEEDGLLWATFASPSLDLVLLMVSVGHGALKASIVLVFRK